MNKVMSFRKKNHINNNTKAFDNRSDRTSVEDEFIG